MGFILTLSRSVVELKKIIKEILGVLVVYIFCTIYGYYNLSEPDNRYSWLISAIILAIIYPIIKIALNKKKK